MRMRFRFFPVAMLTFLAGCTQEQANETAAANSVDVAVLLAPSGRGDGSYNDAALEGLILARGNGINVTTREIGAARPEEYGSTIDRVAGGRPDLVVGVGFLYADPFAAGAVRHPQTSFLILDGEVPNAANVRSITFQADQGSFLAGAAAASETRSNAIGFVGGMNIPIIQSFECGYRSGAAWAANELRRTVTVHAAYIGTTPDAFSNPARGKQLTASMVAQRNADIVYHAAGASGNGVIEAMAERRLRAIGVDFDQNRLAPETVITSMRKRLDLAVGAALSDIHRGAFRGGTYVMNVQNGGVDLVLPGRLSPATVALVERARAALSEGTIQACPATGN
jgi:basic membrane protein A